jgi:hypothetical protein
MRVEWYAANPSFHPIPAGYGLPWGLPPEEEIPEPLVFETQLAAARSQVPPSPPVPQLPLLPAPASEPELVPVPADGPASESLPPVAKLHSLAASNAASAQGATLTAGPTLPHAVSDQPVMRHTRTYNGNDFQFTQLLKEYVYFRDEARAGGWEGYLQRSDDFIRFCCYLHLVEMLSARGGAAESQVVWRWPMCR